MNIKNITIENKKFNNSVDWFISKIKQNTHFKKYWNITDFDFAIKLKHNYKPFFKTKTHVSIPYSNYVCSWSFEDDKYNKVTEHTATKLVFRVSRKFGGRTRTLYRYFIKLNETT